MRVWSNEFETGDLDPATATVSDGRIQGEHLLTDAHGESASLPLRHDQPQYPQIEALTRRARFLDPVAPEVIFRQYTFALEDFAAVNGTFDPTRIHEISFRFDRDLEGAIVLDDLGLCG